MPGVELNYGTTCYFFETKANAEKAIRDVLHRYAHDEVLKAHDDNLIRAVIEASPKKRAIYGGCSIDAIIVEWLSFIERPDNPNSRFAVIRSDGSKYDFAWRWSLYARGARKYLANVLRGEIEEQIEEYRNAHFYGTCEYCHLPLARLDCHVDHAAPVTFDSLVDGWLTALGGVTATAIEIEQSTAYATSSYLKDPVLRDAWATYHRQHAVLRLVHAKCNLGPLRHCIANPVQGFG